MLYQGGGVDCFYAARGSVPKDQGEFERHSEDGEGDYQASQHLSSGSKHDSESGVPVLIADDFDEMRRASRKELGNCPTTLTA